MAKFHRADLLDAFSHPLRTLFGFAGICLAFGGIGKFLSGDLIMGYGFLMVAVWMAGKFTKAQTGIADTLPAKTVAKTLLIYQVIIPVDMVMHKNLPTFSYSSRVEDACIVALSLLPTVFAVPLLLRSVRNKPKTIAIMLLIVQVPLLIGFIFAVLQQKQLGLILLPICLPFVLTPAWLALDLLKKSRLMNAQERAMFI